MSNGKAVKEKYNLPWAYLDVDPLKKINWRPTYIYIYIKEGRINWRPDPLEAIDYLIF
jgi:hypothetical protein